MQVIFRRLYADGNEYKTRSPPINTYESFSYVTARAAVYKFVRNRYINRGFIPYEALRRLLPLKRCQVFGIAD